MEILAKSINLFLISSMFLNTMKPGATEPLSGLTVVPVRHERYLQLHMKWNSTLPKDATYSVTIEHVDTEACIKDSPFDDQKHIKCAPILVAAKNTDVIAPTDATGVSQHECSIQQLCTYSILVEALNYPSSIRDLVVIPDCVEGLCSCHYAAHLPALENIAGYVNLTSNELVVSWKLGTYNIDELPSNAAPELIQIRVRRGTNSELSWGGQHSSIKEVTVPLGVGSHCFDIGEFPGAKYIFLVYMKVIDTQQCEREANPLKVTLPDSDSKTGSSNHLEVQTSTSQHPLFVIAVTLAVIAGIGIGSALLFIHKRRSKNRREPGWREVCVRSSGEHSAIIMSDNVLYVDMEIEYARARGKADHLEVPHSSLRIGREIGKGAFGRVFMASASKLPNTNGTKIVAVKQLKRSPSVGQYDEFLDEITMMKRVGQHPNIVTLLGCCTIKEPLTMIMEYVGCGDLLEYLRKIRAKHLAKVQQQAIGPQVEQVNFVQNNLTNNLFSPMGKYLDLVHTSSSNSEASYITQSDANNTRPSLAETTYTMLSGSQADGVNLTGSSRSSLEYVLDNKELHNFAKQIACGMEHLEELGITHRDLAARNILIDERKTLKISDFGLSRKGIYVNSINKKVPLRWLSIEAIRDKLYSNKSDVWAFGIVLWEIGTLGGYPYPDIGNHELQSFLEQGKRLERPENCTPEVYELMLQCWLEDPQQRPSFEQISKQLDPHKKIYIDFSDIEPTYVFPPTSDQLRLAIVNNK